MKLAWFEALVILAGLVGLGLFGALVVMWIVGE